MMNKKAYFWQEQKEKNDALLASSKYLGREIRSQVLPFQLDIAKNADLHEEQKYTIQALEIEAARIAIKSLASLAKINELDHLGGGLGLISPLIMTLAVVDYQKIEYTIENAHSSIGYYAALAAYGFLDQESVIEKFRRSLDIAGHVSWLPGGTPLNGGRLGVMIPVAVGQALGKKALYGEGVWVITHCGDAGWISGQALNGFNAADLHNAPITFVMDRNGIQLSGANKDIMNKDPRPIIESLGITILEIPSIHETADLYQAYHQAYTLAQQGRPSLIYPVGYRSSDNSLIDLNQLGARYNIREEVKQFAGANDVALNTQIWIPGSLMSYRDVIPMLECIFLVNGLKGGAGHHDGHMKGRDLEKVLSNPMLQISQEQKKNLNKLTKKPRKQVVTIARPEPGTKNLIIPKKIIDEIELPLPGKKVSPRAGVEAGYAAVAKAYPENVFIIGCDLDTSTKLGKAKTYLNADHKFEMSIQEQVSALMANGLAMSSKKAQLNVFSTFAAFFEGIAREGFELWRYQRNLNGINEGLNVTMHMSHVGSCTGRDHFSGWSLDWVNLAISYLPYLHHFYAPADARSAFIAVCDLAAHYGGHIIGIPRDNLPVLSKQGSNEPLWDISSGWESVTMFRSYPNAKNAILAFGAPAFLAAEAAGKLNTENIKTDVYIINGLPLEESFLPEIFRKYSGGIVTVEDGIIGCRRSGLRGFAGIVNSTAYGHNVKLEHIGIIDPRIATSDGHVEVWDHFGITTEALINAIKSL
jgi:transketolase N-terminal domain/subunit/transketolase C-terminal domain/subunit